MAPCGAQAGTAVVNTPKWFELLQLPDWNGSISIWYSDAPMTGSHMITGVLDESLPMSDMSRMWMFLTDGATSGGTLSNVFVNGAPTVHGPGWFAASYGLTRQK